LGCRRRRGGRNRLLARSGPFSLNEPAPQLVNRPPLFVEFPLEGSQPPGEPDLPKQGDNREHRDCQADQREKQGNHVHDQTTPSPGDFPGLPRGKLCLCIGGFRD
jgi:hypothetical protein